MAVRMTKSDLARAGIAEAKEPGPRKGAKKPKVGYVIDWAKWGLPVPATEWKFHPTRKWRLDWAWINSRVALECDGGAWSGGRHTRGSGFIKDQEKRNAALLLGWRVFHCVPADIKSGSIFATLREALCR